MGEQGQAAGRPGEAVKAQAGTDRAPGAAAVGAASAEAAERGDAGNPPPAEAAKGCKLSEIDVVRFDCIRGALYHDDREQHYARCHRLIMFVTIASAMASIAEPLQTWLRVGPTLFQFVAALAAVVDIVWDVSGKARLHANLKRVAYDILADAEEDNADVSRLRVRVARSAVDEPPIMHAVNALAFNMAARSMGRSRASHIEIGGTAKAFRHWRAFTAADFPDPD